jgi:hypothetical protein
MLLTPTSSTFETPPAPNAGCAPLVGQQMHRVGVLGFYPVLNGRRAGRRLIDTADREARDALILRARPPSTQLDIAVRAVIRVLEVDAPNEASVRPDDCVGFPAEANGNAGRFRRTADDDEAGRLIDRDSGDRGDVAAGDVAVIPQERCRVLDFDLREGSAAACLDQRVIQFRHNAVVEIDALPRESCDAHLFQARHVAEIHVDADQCACRKAPADPKSVEAVALIRELSRANYFSHLIRCENCYPLNCT